MKTENTIKFAVKNVKLKKLAKKIGGKVASFNIRAGYNCPCAKDCLSRVVETDNGLRILDGKNTQFRCYAASCEVRMPNVYHGHKNNEQILQLCRISPSQAIKLLCEKIPRNTKAVRIHSSGDFKTEAYFKVWLNVAKKNPDIIFYSYTKMIPFWIKHIKEIEKIPNFRLTASYGGKHDNLIKKYNLRSVKVVYSEKEAKKLGLPIDIDDSQAYGGMGNFALVIHGTQPPNTLAAKAWYKIIHKIK